MKENYTAKKRTSIALDPELTKRIAKVLGDKKLAEFAREVINRELEIQETKQTLKKFEKLGDSGQYLKIKRLETDIENLKKDQHSFEKELSYFKKEYAYEEKYDKHGHFEEGLTKLRKKEPELTEIFEKWSDKLSKEVNEYKKRQFKKKGYSEQDWEKMKDGMREIRGHKTKLELSELKKKLEKKLKKKETR